MSKYKASEIDRIIEDPAYDGYETIKEGDRTYHFSKRMLAIFNYMEGTKPDESKSESYKSLWLDFSNEGGN